LCLQPSFLLSLSLSVCFRYSASEVWCGVVWSTSVVNSCFQLFQFNVIFQFPPIEKIT
jgi:hypothetical protein